MANKALFSLMFLCSYALRPSTRSTNSYVRKNQPFLTNKANFLKAQMNVNKVLTKDYEKKTLGESGKNKPNSNPIQTQSNPIKPN